MNRRQFVTRVTVGGALAAAGTAASGESNPGQEVMIALGGRIMSNPQRSVEDALTEVLERTYRPNTAEALNRRRGVFCAAEDSYFGQWSDELFHKQWGIPVPGEFKLDQRLFGTSPGPATYLKELCLDAKGRAEYRKGMTGILQDLPKLTGACDDHGRLERIARGVTVTLNLLNTISYCLGEALPWALRDHGRTGTGHCRIW